MTITAKCDNCETLHTKKDRYTYCICGKVLEWVVPIFKQSDSGYLLVEVSLLTALLDLKKNGPVSPQYGICFNVTFLTGQSVSYDDVMAVAARWPKATDCLSYPIPNKSRELWTGDAGALRYELINFMIKELSDDT